MDDSIQAMRQVGDQAQALKANMDDLGKRSLDINVNLNWGLVLLVFGAAMLTLAWRGGKTNPPAK